MSRETDPGDGDAAPALRRVDRLEDLPEPVPDADFVVIDVIISSTSVVRLLEAGAAYVRPFADPEEAIAWADGAGDALLVGEQGGESIEGFDCGPLPSVLADRDVEGRPVGILTSNGTRAVHRIGREEGVFVGSTVNAEAVASVLRQRDRDAWLVAAGRAGEVVTEDVVGAELVERHYRGDPSAEALADLADDLRGCGTASWLEGLGFEHEVAALCEFDSTDVVPRLREGRFVAH